MELCAEEKCKRDHIKKVLDDWNYLSWVLVFNK